MDGRDRNRTCKGVTLDGLARRCATIAPRGHKRLRRDLNPLFSARQADDDTLCLHRQKRRREESNPLDCYIPLFSRQLPTVRRHLHAHYNTEVY